MGNLGIRLPQLTVINSVHAHRTARGRPAIRAVDDATTRSGARLDGGYTIANGAANLHELPRTASGFSRTSFRALQLVALHQLRIGGRFLQEAGFKKRWTGEDRTVFEDIRVNDPAPGAAIPDEEGPQKS